MSNPAHVIESILTAPGRAIGRVADFVLGAKPRKRPPVPPKPKKRKRSQQTIDAKVPRKMGKSDHVLRDANGAAIKVDFAEKIVTEEELREALEPFEKKLDALDADATETDSEFEAVETKLEELVAETTELREENEKQFEALQAMKDAISEVQAHGGGGWKVSATRDNSSNLFMLTALKDRGIDLSEMMLISGGQNFDGSRVEVRAKEDGTLYIDTIDVAFIFDLLGSAFFGADNRRTMGRALPPPQPAPTPTP